MKKADKDKIKQSILAQKAEFESQLAMSEAASQPVELDQALAGRVSRIDAIQQQELAQANQQRAQLKLRKLESALAHLETDDFGYCEDCGQPISLERLAIKPDSLCCVNCQEARETT